jgi:hypothetical protein
MFHGIWMANTDFVIGNAHEITYTHVNIAMISVYTLWTHTMSLMQGEHLLLRVTPNDLLDLPQAGDGRQERARDVPERSEILSSDDEGQEDER